MPGGIGGGGEGEGGDERSLNWRSNKQDFFNVLDPS